MINYICKCCNYSTDNKYNFMRKNGILVNLHYIPVYRQPFYESLGFKVGYCPEAEEYYKQTLSIPIYPKLHDDQIDEVIFTLRKSLNS